MPYVYHGGCIPVSAPAGHGQLDSNFGVDGNKGGLGLDSLQKH